MSIRGDVTIECDVPTCQAEQVFSGQALWDEHERMLVLAHEAGWRINWEGRIVCPQCFEEGKR
jgi:hypothetical protein